MAYGDDWGTNEDYGNPVNELPGAEIPGSVATTPNTALTSLLSPFGQMFNSTGAALASATTNLGKFFDDVAVKLKIKKPKVVSQPGAPVITTSSGFFDQQVFGLPLPIVVLGAAAGVYYMKKRKRGRRR